MKPENNLRLAQLAGLGILARCFLLTRHNFFSSWTTARGWHISVFQWLVIFAGIFSGVWGFVLQRRVLSRRSSKPLYERWRLGNLVRLWTALAAGLCGFVLYLLHGAWGIVDAFFMFGFILLIGWQPGTPPTTHDSEFSKEPNQSQTAWWQIELKNFDQAFAWLILADGIFAILRTEIRHPPGAVLDVGLLFIFLAMFNLLRIRYADVVSQLRTYCIAANVAALVLEIIRLKMFGGVARLTTGILVIQTIFSILRVRTDLSSARTLRELPGTIQPTKQVDVDDSVSAMGPLGKNMSLKSYNQSVSTIFFISILMAVFTYQLGKAKGSNEKRVAEYTSLKAQYDGLQKEYSRLEAEYADLKSQYDRIESGHRRQPKR